MSPDYCELVLLWYGRFYAVDPAWRSYGLSPDASDVCMDELDFAGKKTGRWTLLPPQAVIEALDNFKKTLGESDEKEA